MEGKWKVQVARCKVQGYLECGLWIVEGLDGSKEARKQGARADTSCAQLSQTSSPSSPTAHIRQYVIERTVAFLHT